CDAHASDLNPVAFIILRTILDYDAKSIDSLAQEFQDTAALVMKEVKANLREYYPNNKGNESVGYFWARTVQCEGTNCGAEIPLLKSFWLSTARQAKAALRYKIRKSGAIPTIDFEVFAPKSAAEVPNPTVSRAKARCLCCGTVLHPDRVRAQL